VAAPQCSPNRHRGHNDGSINSSLACMAISGSYMQAGGQQGLNERCWHPQQRRSVISLTLSDTERAALVTAADREWRAQRWRRYQAVLLVADGQRPEQVATGVRRAVGHPAHRAARGRSTAAWALRHGLDGPALAWARRRWWISWSASIRCVGRAAAGIAVEMTEACVRLPRPGVRGIKRAIAAAVGETLAVGGSVWHADEATCGVVCRHTRQWSATGRRGPRARRE
jgi:hypothetical protein